MAKEIDKIIQSKTAPKSNNVLWDDGENLKINRNGKWESTGTSVPQEKLDSIDFGYYTYASGNIVANWGPFTIKEGETIKVETNTWVEPEYIKIHDYSGVGYAEKGNIYGLSKHPDGTSGTLSINTKLQGTTLEIHNKGNLGTVTISFLNYQKQLIDSSRFIMSSDFIADIPLYRYIFTNVNERFELMKFINCVGKELRLDWDMDGHSGFCVYAGPIESGYRVILLRFPSVVYVTYTIDNNGILTEVQVEEKTISVV